MLSKSYRDFVDWLGLMDSLWRRLRLRTMPHFTTLHKFSLRLEPHTLDGMVATLASSVVVEDVDAIIDSTGMQSGNASFYYVRTMSLRAGSKGTYERAVRRHIKLTLVVDARTMTILSMLATPGPDADFNKLVPALSKAVDAGFGIGTISADKGYDSESNRRFVRQELGAEAHIPLRQVGRRACDHHGFYRRRQRAVFDERLYRRRSLVETVNSMLKRTMSSTALARRERAQYAELALRAVAHNAKRAVELG
jgi:transposase